MTENQRYLLKFLDTTFWKSSKKLAAELDCSIRTLRKYVADINMDTGRLFYLPTWDISSGRISRLKSYSRNSYRKHPMNEQSIS